MATGTGNQPPSEGVTDTELDPTWLADQQELQEIRQEVVEWLDERNEADLLAVEESLAAIHQERTHIRELIEEATVIGSKIQALCEENRKMGEDIQISQKAFEKTRLALETTEEDIRKTKGELAAIRVAIEEENAEIEEQKKRVEKEIQMARDFMKSRGISLPEPDDEAVAKINPEEVLQEVEEYLKKLSQRSKSTRVTTITTTQPDPVAPSSSPATFFYTPPNDITLTFERLDPFEDSDAPCYAHRKKLSTLHMLRERLSELLELLTDWLESLRPQEKVRYEDPGSDVIVAEMRENNYRR